MTFSVEYEAFFAKGGKIEVLPGFEGYVPLPPHRGKKARRSSNALTRGSKVTRTPKTRELLETEDGVTLLWIALECGYSSRGSLASNSSAYKFVPAPVTTTGRFRQDIYNKEQALVAVAKIKEFRASARRKRHKNHTLPDKE